MFFYFLLFALYFRPFACSLLEWGVEFEINNNTIPPYFDKKSKLLIITRADEINISVKEEDHFFIFSIDKETKTISSSPKLIGIDNQTSKCNVLSFIDIPINTSMALVLGKIIFAENDVKEFYLSYNLDIFHRSNEGITYQGKIDSKTIVSMETIAPILSMIKPQVDKARIEMLEAEAIFSLLSLSNPANYNFPAVYPMDENLKGMVLDSFSKPFLIDGMIAGTTTEDQTAVLNYMFNEENVLSFIFFSSLSGLNHFVGFSREKSTDQFVKVGDNFLSTDSFDKLMDGLVLEYNTFINSGKPISNLGWVSLKTQKDTNLFE